MNFLGFKEKVKSSFNLDLNAYKERQLKRRIDSLMVKLNQDAGNYYSFWKLLVADRGAYMHFLDTLTINVSEFFRDKSMFIFLEEKVFPLLLAKRKVLKIWSAACSSGAEPYSLAIILDEMTPGYRHLIEGSDIDRNILQAAAYGRYSHEQVRNVSRLRLENYFNKEGSLYVLKDSIKRKVSFRQHDLLLSPFGMGYDLIACRNVTIYFTREAQENLNIKFYRALNHGGVLFIGASEMIFNYHELGFEKMSSCFYLKK